MPPKPDLKEKGFVADASEIALKLKNEGNELQKAKKYKGKHCKNMSSL